MSNKKESSIDWLSKRMQSNLYTIDELIDYAKAMHKVEVIQAYANGHNDGCRFAVNHKQEFEHATSYYNETFEEPKK